MKTVRFLLLPFVPLYSLIVKLRNLLFDIGILQSKSFDIPIINVGNLTVGGTGKTPLIEYLIRLLGANQKIATLSRGYKRKTSGFRIASDNDTAMELGDEPMQYFNKFKDITIALHERRRKGIKLLLQKIPELKYILLDDAFQHRYVKPSLNILVTDYYHLYVNDSLLPFGNLREHISGAKRADIIVVTKTPAIFSPLVRKQLLLDLNPKPNQLVCFSYIRYGSALPVFNSFVPPENPFNDIYSILMIAGIGDPDPFKEYLKRHCSDLDKMTYPDHYYYSNADLLAIKEKYLSLPSKRKIIVTTEKDAMRLRSLNAEKVFGDLPFYYVPIVFDFHTPEKQIFDSKILNLSN